MQKLQILQSSVNTKLSELPKKHLLIDTNFLIDAARYTAQFKELLETLRRSGFTLVSIDATLVEFVKGSKSIEDYSKKVKFYKSIIEQILPFDSTIRNHVSDITRALLKKGGQLSYADCLLLGAVMKYESSLYLLTKDRSDIPVSIFNPVASIIIETSDNNCTFNIYEYNEKAYKDLLITLVGDN